MKKHSIIFLTALAAAALSCNVFAQTKTVNMRIGDSQMTVNGEVSELDSPPVIIDSRTLVPIRAIVEALDGKVQWYGETKTAVLQNKDGKSVTLTINSTEALQTGEKVQLDTPPVIINGRTMLPIRFVAESFGYKTDWNADDKSIVISDGEISETETKPETKAFDLTGYEENFIARDASGKEYYMMYRESEDAEPVAYLKIKDKNGKDIAVYKEMDVWGTVYADKSGKNITIAYNSEDESYTIVTNGTEKKAAIGDSYLPTDEDGNTYENPDSDALVVKDKSGKVVGEYTATGESWVYYVDEAGSTIYTVTARDGGYKDGFVSSDGKYTEFEENYDGAYMGSDNKIYTTKYNYLLICDDHYKLLDEAKSVPDGSDIIYVGDDGTEYIVTGDLAYEYTLKSDKKTIKLTCDPEEEHNKKLFAGDSYGSDDTIYYNGDDGKVYVEKDYVMTVYGSDGKEEGKISLSRYDERYSSKSGKTYIYSYVYGTEEMYITIDGETITLGEIMG